MSQVQQFYAGQNIFITGGTGFLGKVLTEKLLRSCPEIGTIYLLIRAKKGKSTRERIDELFVDSIFDVLRDDYPDFSQKLVGVAGDVTEEGLGLSATDHARIVNEISMIFHLAASVRFDERLETAVAINVNSAKYIVDIAKACKNLKVGIYVSTAYSHCVRSSIKEKLYPPPLTYEGVNNLVEIFGKNKRTEDEMKNFTEREPIPGWVSGPVGVQGILCAIGLGLLHIGISDPNIIIDIVPVDYVCNALISSAWETALTKRRHPEEIPVYNYVSGNRNPVTFKEHMDRFNTCWRIFPTNLAVYYPFVITTKKKQLYLILEFFLHSIPALTIDAIARLFGKHPGLTKVMHKIGGATRVFQYFTTQQWNFEDQRIENLWKRMGPTDRRTFPFSIQDVDRDEHAMKTTKGLRKYLIRDPDGNLEQARRRHVYLYIVHVLVRLSFGLLVLWVTWKLFSGRGLTITPENFAM